MASRFVQIYDTTLRDGTQREGISYTVLDKLRIARRLDALGVAYIEGGWPGSNPKDAEFFQRAREEHFKHAKLTAFGMTRRSSHPPEEDPNLKALLEAATPVCTLFGKSWTLHVTEVLRTTLDQNLLMIEDSVRFLKNSGREVIYDAEHFFDGYAADPKYALETLKAAARGGASAVVLCDTNGGTLPWQIEDLVRIAINSVPAPVGIHAHNDAGCAVANSLAAVRAGAVQVQGTVNGYGERCGNANLSAIIPNLELKLGVSCVPPGKVRDISELSRFVSDVANLTFDEHAPYVGNSAFAHKGGVHVAAMRRHPDSYQHITPEFVGNCMRVVVSELSGKGNILSKAEELGLQGQFGDEGEALQEVKDAEARGLSFESAEASLGLLLRRREPDYVPPFSILDYHVMVGRRAGSSETFAEATVKLRIGEQVVHTAGAGNGPVSALSDALLKALTPVFPHVSDVHLADYKVRILDSKAGTEAITRVLIDSHDQAGGFSTVGASPNIIDASLAALVDSLEFYLLRSSPETKPASIPAPQAGAEAREAEAP